MNDYRRLNVALTRARHSCWVIGCRRAFEQADENWASLIGHCGERKVLFDVQAIQSLLDNQKVTKASIQAKLTGADVLPIVPSKLFDDALWELSIKKRAIERSQKLSKEHFERLVQFIKIISSGKTRRGPRMREENVLVDGRNQVHQLVRVERVKEYRVLWTVFLRADEDCYTQILHIWSVVHQSEIQEAFKELVATLSRYDERVIDMCMQESRTTSINGNSRRDVLAPISFPKDSVEVSDFFQRTQISDSISGPTSNLIIDKSYQILLSSIEQVLRLDFSRKELPFQLSDTEVRLVRHASSSLFVLGRSGTGKTTVALHKMHERILASEMLESTDFASVRQVIVTASPRLCQAMRDYWSKLLVKIEDVQLQEFADPDTAATDGQEVADEIDDAAVDEGLNEAGIEVANAENEQEGETYPKFWTFRQFLLHMNSNVSCPFRGLGSTPTLTSPSGNSDEDLGSDESDVESSYYEFKLTDTAPKARYMDPASVFEKEIQFEQFRMFYWNHISQDVRRKFDAATLWTEIQGSIKGSLDVVHKKSPLSLSEYLDLAKKRVSFIGSDDRRLIYPAYLAYEKRKAQRGEFDINDLSLHLYCEILKNGYHGEMMHYVSIDEVQDLSPLQICLFRLICNNLNGFLFAGDTAQTIAAGVGFRFEDIRSLFYTDFIPNMTSGHDALVPPVQTLTRNYRSHAGVINLATTIVDALIKFFPFTIDKLPPERAMISGQAPLFLKDTSEENLMLNLFGTKSERRQAEFGAEQAIIVRNSVTKKRLMAAINSALILTVEESKGLEFEDVLIYDFFQDSGFNTWRLIYHMSEKDRGDLPAFDMAKHQLLCVELKKLYVALTRAKSTLWFFDRDLSRRQPILELWSEKGFIRLVESTGNDDITPLAKKSSRQLWKKRGMEFFQRQNYEMAERCFKQAGDLYNQKVSHAMLVNIQAVELMEKGKTPAARKLFAEVAETYLEISRKTQAAKFFVKAHEFARAVDLFEEVGAYSDALMTAIEGKLYGRSLTMLEACRQSKSLDDAAVENFAYRLAYKFHKTRQGMKMKQTVLMLESYRRRCTFFRRYGHEDLLLQEYRRQNDNLALGKWFGEQGDFLKSASYFMTAQDIKSAAHRLVDYGRVFLIMVWSNFRNAVSIIDGSAKQLWRRILENDSIPVSIRAEIAALNCIYRDNCSFETLLQAYHEAERLGLHYLAFALAHRLIIKINVASMDWAQHRNLFLKHVAYYQDVHRALTRWSMSGVWDANLLHFFGITRHSNPNKCYISAYTYAVLTEKKNPEMGLSLVEAGIEVVAKAATNIMTSVMQLSVKYMHITFIDLFKSLCPCHSLLPLTSISCERANCRRIHDFAKAQQATERRITFAKSFIPLILAWKSARILDTSDARAIVVEMSEVLKPYYPALSLMRSVIDFHRDIAVQSLVDYLKDELSSDKQANLRMEAEAILMTSLSEHGLHENLVDKGRNQDNLSSANLAIYKLRMSYRAKWFCIEPGQDLPGRRAAIAGLEALILGNESESAFNEIHPLHFVMHLERAFVLAMTTTGRVQNLVMPGRYIAEHVQPNAKILFGGPVHFPRGRVHEAAKELIRIFSHDPKEVFSYVPWITKHKCESFEPHILNRLCILLVTYVVNFFESSGQPVRVLEKISKSSWRQSPVGLHKLMPADAKVMVSFLREMGEGPTLLLLQPKAPLNLAVSSLPGFHLTTLNGEPEVVSSSSLAAIEKAQAAADTVDAVEDETTDMEGKSNALDYGEEKATIQLPDRVMNGLKRWLNQTRDVLAQLRNASTPREANARVFFKQRPELDSYQVELYMKRIIPLRWRLSKQVELVNDALKNPDVFQTSEEVDVDEVVDRAMEFVEDGMEVMKRVDDIRSLFLGEDSEQKVVKMMKDLEAALKSSDKFKGATKSARKEQRKARNGKGKRK